MDLKGASVLVTGATGFVGPYLVSELARKKATVKILSLDDCSISLNNYIPELEIIKGDITNSKSLDGITEGVDFIFHLAAISNVDFAIKNPVKTYDVNLRGTLNLLEKMRKNPVEKLIYISSSHVYGVPQYIPIDEKHPIAPREPYASSKAAAENIINAYSSTYNVNTAIVRPFNIYGPGQDEGFLIPSLIKQAAGSNFIEVGNLEPTRDFTYITDVIAGFMKIAESGSGVYNVGSGIEIKVGDILRKIVEIVNPNIEIRSVAARQRSDSVEISRLCADVSKLRGIGWTPKVGMEEGLEKLLMSRS